MEAAKDSKTQFTAGPANRNDARRDFITSPKPTREWLQCWGRIDADWRNERSAHLIFKP